MNSIKSLVSQKIAKTEEPKKYSESEEYLYKMRKAFQYMGKEQFQFSHNISTMNDKEMENRNISSEQRVSLNSI